VVASPNTSTVVLQVVRGDEKGTRGLGVYNWATLFLGDINMGTWASRLGEPRISDKDSDPRTTALANANSNCKRQTRPLVREGGPHQQTRKCLILIKIWSWTPDGCMTRRQTGRLTVRRNITLTSKMFKWKLHA
jgi:hypothetical protein